MIANGWGVSGIMKKMKKENGSIDSLVMRIGVSTENEPIVSDYDLQGRGIRICSVLVLFLESPSHEIDGLRRSRVGSEMRERGVSHRLVLVCFVVLSCIAPVCCSWIWFTCHEIVVAKRLGRFLGS